MMHRIIQKPVKNVTLLQLSSQDVAEEKGNPDILGPCSVLLYSLILRAAVRPCKPSTIKAG